MVYKGLFIMLFPGRIVQLCPNVHTALNILLRVTGRLVLMMLEGQDVWRNITVGVDPEYQLMRSEESHEGLHHLAMHLMMMMI